MDALLQCGVRAHSYLEVSGSRVLVSACPLGLMDTDGKWRHCSSDPSDAPFRTLRRFTRQLLSNRSELRECFTCPRVTQINRLELNRLQWSDSFQRESLQLLSEELQGLLFISRVQLSYINTCADAFFHTLAAANRQGAVSQPAPSPQRGGGTATDPARAETAAGGGRCLRRVGVPVSVAAAIGGGGTGACSDSSCDHQTVRGSAWRAESGGAPRRESHRFGANGSEEDSPSWDAVRAGGRARRMLASPVVVVP